ncbi:MAG: FAD-binding oxidoreductase [Gemmatimonadaceae bacterium]
MTAQALTTADVSAIVRDAHDRHARLRIAGRATWPGRQSAVAADAELLDLSALSGIVEYVPGDLTLTARAGTTLTEVEAATLEHGQWCPLMPWGGDDGSLGATFATATHGPCSASLGTPRDLAIGMEFVDGTGSVIRAGGRVVKNVAGFDLTRLMVGAWGTLGAITEISVRLRARPAVDETWSAIIGDAGAARASLTDLFRGPLAPLTHETFEGRTYIRLGGNAALVAAARAEVKKTFSGVEPADPAVWTRIRRSDPRPRASLTDNALAGPLAVRVKKQFDPRHILNPGIMGEHYA